MRSRIRSHACLNTSLTKKGIKHFRKKLTPAVCTCYINHLHHVIPVVIENDGGPSGFQCFIGNIV